jgi:hypothetical protein
MNENINNAENQASPSGGLGVNNNNVVTKNPPFRGLGGNKI